jgi:hypothetical protein
MRIAILLIFLMSCKAAQAHNPDIASMMIYEQNGKTILLIKSSLTAFESGVNYIFGKEAYKSPEEFIRLVLYHFKNNCFVTVNGRAISLRNMQVQLGHETNLFAELDSVPKAINSLYVKNTVFKDMPNNRCELIVTINGLPQKQYILDDSNKQEVLLQVNDKKLVADKPARALYTTKIFLFGLAVLVIGVLVFFVLRKRKIKSASSIPIIRK